MNKTCQISASNEYFYLEKIPIFLSENNKPNKIKRLIPCKMPRDVLISVNQYFFAHLTISLL